MRVKRMLVTLLVMLLTLGVLAPAAGAIYMEGQTIPDDGMMHILAAESGLSDGASAGTQADADIPSGALPSYVWDDWSSAGLPAGFPVSMPAFDGMTTSPPVSVPSEIADPSDSVIEKQLPAAAGGLWSFFDTGNLQTNMPILGNSLL